MIQHTPIVVTPPRSISERTCGYCHSNKKDHHSLASRAIRFPDSPLRPLIIGSYCEHILAADYSELMSQGFRRLGSFLYKPDLLNGCCRLYTIRTSLSYATATKELRQTINRFARATGALKPSHTRGANSRFELTNLIAVEGSQSRFHTRFEPAEFSKEKFALYCKYQVAVHNDNNEDLSEDSFTRFLCDSPFPDHEVNGTKQEWDQLNNWVSDFNSNKPATAHSPRIGPAHECYYWDDKLIAISVLDFLPCGVLSIYFIWDPQYAHLLLGTLLGIRELLLCNHLGLEHYYLGYYATDCVKMKYKQKFGGEILDLVNEVYVPIPVAAPFVEDGRLFVLGIGFDLDDSIGHERRLDNTGRPRPFTKTPFSSHPLVNIAEQIYDPGAERIADSARMALLKYHGVDLEPELSSSAVPTVCPGITPLWQIVDMFELGTFGSQFVTTLFRIQTNKMERVSFAHCTRLERRHIVDCVRVYGIEKVRLAVIIV